MPGRLFPPRRMPREGEVDLRAPLSAFGRYDLLEKIGEGRSSETFVARSDGFEGLFRLVALKRLKAELCSDVDVVSRFIEEARLAARVEHPASVGVDDFGRVGGVYFTAFELVDGVTLELLLARLRSRRLALDPRAAAWIVRAVAHAVDAVHRTTGADGGALGLVHGDLQPKNVLVARDGRIKVTGLAAPSLFAAPSVLVAGVGLTGVLRQAPEVLAGAPPSPRSDVWSLGALLFELLTGEALFSLPSPATVADAIEVVRSAPLLSPSARRPGTPTVLDGVVEEALARDPLARPDAAAWARGLDELLAHYGAPAFLACLEDLDDDDARGAALATGSRPATRVQGPLPLASIANDDTRPGAQRPVPGVADAAGVAVERSRHEGGGEEREQVTHRSPGGPWGLVRFAERTVEEGRVDEARAMFRTAAVVFASRGLLAHALCAYDGARATLSAHDVSFDLRRLAELAAVDVTMRQQFRRQELRRVGGLAYFEALREHTESLDHNDALSTPFLSALSPEAFARLGSLARVRRVPAQTHVLREGEPGDSLFAIGEGRLVVTCTPSRGGDDTAVAGGSDAGERTDPGIVIVPRGPVVAAGLEDELRALEERVLDLVDPGERRVFLSALTAGDVFGEFSFLTGRPRSASVEAVTACRILEIGRRAVGGLLDEHPALKEALEGFYKERVIEWMLAKNEVFSLLEPAARRTLLSRCGLFDIPARKIVVREGELHDAMYFIKRGEVEVSFDDAGVAVFINKLGPGEFFGEIAALEGGPRRASVRAVTDLEVFRITRKDLQHVLQDAPAVKERLEQAMRSRSAELHRRIVEQRRVLAST